MANLLPIYDERADQLIVLEHWHADCGSRSAEFCGQADRSGFRGVGSMNELFRAHGTIEQATWCRSSQENLPLSLGQFRRRTKLRRQVECFAVEAEQRAEFG